MNKLTKIATSLLCLLAMTSPVMADSLLLEEAMLGRGRNSDSLDDIDKYYKCKKRTRKIFEEGEITLYSTKLNSKVKLCVDATDYDTNGWNWRMPPYDASVFSVGSKGFIPGTGPMGEDFGTEIY